LALGHFSQAEDIVTRLLSFQGPIDVSQFSQLAGMLRFHQGRYDEAAAFLRRAVQLTPQDDLGHPAFAGLRLYLAAADAELGNLPAARADLADFRAAAPQVRRPADFWRWNDPVRLPLIDRDRLASDLARIGWRDG
jgi:tetratricopeptide (TPR) repeat protein